MRHDRHSTGRGQAAPPVLQARRVANSTEYSQDIREDELDRVYITAAAKNDAIVEHITELHSTRQPILVGTRDVAESEELHERLVKAGIPAVVLNAKNDAEEAAVIAEAGTLGSVAGSAQMAGRGTDIRLGGSDEADHDDVAELSVACT